MTPKEKAKELVDSYIYKLPTANRVVLDKNLTKYKRVHLAKQCALICVDEIIKSKPFIWKEDSINSGYVGNSKYWQEVKKEIENL